jgi:hypothetical protein
MLICNLAKDPERFTPLSHLILDRLSLTSLTSLPTTQVVTALISLPTAQVVMALISLPTAQVVMA